jgi:hypothetical protein
MGRPRLHVNDAAKQRAYRLRKKEQPLRRVCEPVYKAILWAAEQGYPLARAIVESCALDRNFGRNEGPPPLEGVMAYLRLHILNGVEEYQRRRRRFHA